MNSFIIEQKITAFVNQYYAYEGTADGGKGRLLAFAQQKRFAFKEEILFYADDSKSRVVFGVKAENIMDIHGKFLITDAEGSVLGSLRKDFKSSLLRSTWDILDLNTIICKVQESSVPLAIFRRIWGFVPYLSDLPFFLKYHFDFINPDTQAILAKYTKTTLLRDHYRIDVLDDSLQAKVNWQTLVAQAVLLDALQGR